jgi:hypothetical protein
MRSFLALVLLSSLGAAAPAAAQEKGAAQRFAMVDKMLDSASAMLGDYQKCLNETNRLQYEADAKRRELIQRYGSLPQANNYERSALQLKDARVERQREICAQQTNVSGALDQAGDALRGVEPKSLPGFKERRDRLGTLRNRYQQMVMKQRGAKAPKLKPGQQAQGDAEPESQE